MRLRLAMLAVALTAVLFTPSASADVTWQYGGGAPEGTTAINNSGEVAGYEVDDINATAFKWSAATGRVTLPRLDPGCPLTLAHGIADDGTVAGMACQGERQSLDEKQYPVVWTDTGIRNLGAPSFDNGDGHQGAYGVITSVAGNGHFGGTVAQPVTNEEGEGYSEDRAVSGNVSGGWSYAGPLESSGGDVSLNDIITYRSTLNNERYFLNGTELPNPPFDHKDGYVFSAPRADGWMWVRTGGAGGTDRLWKNGTFKELKWPANSQAHRLGAVGETGPLFGYAYRNETFSYQAVIFDSVDAQGEWFTSADKIIAVSDDGNWAATQTGNTYTKGVDFKVTRTGPGRYTFESLAQGAGDFQWNFGDGETAEGKTVTHTYEKPGTFTVAHGFTPEAGGSQQVARKQVTVAPPALAVDIALPGHEGPLPLDTEIDAKVTVSAGGDGVGRLSNLVFNGAILKATPADRVAISRAAPPDAFALDPGDSRSFTVGVKGLTRGDAKLTSAVSGKDASGAAVADDGARNVRVGEDIKVTVTPTPAAVELNEVDAETQRPKPKPVSVDVKLENVAGEAIRDVKLSLTLLPVTSGTRNPSAPEPLQLRTGPAPASGPGPAITNATAKDIDAGDLATGAQKTLRFTAEAVDGADVDIKALALGAAGPAPGRTVRGAGTGRVKIGAKFLLRFESKIVGDPPPATIRGGDHFTIKGEVENLSAEDTMVVRVAGRRLGNVVEGTLGDLENPDPCGCGVVKELLPGEKVVVWAQMHSAEGGGTRASIRFRVEGWVVNADGTETEITDEEKIITPGSDAHEVHIVTQDPPPEPVTWQEGVGILGLTFVEGIGRAVEGLISLGEMQGRFIQSATSPWTWPGEYQRLMVWLQGYTREVYQGLTPAEQEAWRNDTAQALATFRRISLAEAHGLVDRGIQESFLPLTNGWYTNDTRAVLGWVGGFAGENVDALVDIGAAGIGLCKLLRRSGIALRVASREAAEQTATLTTRIAARGRKGLLDGDRLTFAQATRLWRMDIGMDIKLRAYASARRLVIAVRDRGPGSIRRLAEGFLGKIEAMKAKNVTQTDIDWLGFHPDHNDIAMIKQMPEEQVVKDLLAARGADDDTQAKVLARWKQRKDEWDGAVRAEMEAFDEQGKVWVPSEEFGINPLNNQLPVQNPGDVYDFWDFRISKAGENGFAATTDGLDAFIPQAHVNGRWRGFTGDMDPIAILDENLRILSPELRRIVYKELAALGFNHGESLTWDNPVGRQKYLYDYDVSNPNADSLLGYMADGSRRSVRFDLAKSWWEGTGARRGFMFLHGAHIVLETVTPSTAPFTPPQIPDTNHFFRPGGPNGARFGTGPDTPLLRTRPDGSLEAWTKEGGWKPFGAPAPDNRGARASARRPTTMLPQTGLSANVPAGTTQLPVIAPEKLRLAKGKNAWFRKGRKVVIDPSGPNQELGVIAANGSVVLRTPTTKPHAAGELVGMAPRTGGKPKFRGRPKLSFIRLSARRGTVKLLVQNGHRFAVTGQARLGRRGAAFRLGPWRQKTLTFRGVRGKRAKLVAKVRSRADRGKLRRRVALR